MERLTRSKRTLPLTLAISSGLNAAAEAQPGERRFQPDDLYRVRRITATSWLRYVGEGHTIEDRANVLDLWQRLSAWLTETMAPRAAAVRSR